MATNVHFYPEFHRVRTSVQLRIAVTTSNRDCEVFLENVTIQLRVF